MVRCFTSAFKQKGHSSHDAIHGLSKETARPVRSADPVSYTHLVTIRPARLLGLENRVGSLEVGKDADIAIFDGMPFENLTSCLATIIDGKLEHCAL